MALGSIAEADTGTASVLRDELDEADGDPDEEEDDWPGGAEDSGIADLGTLRAEDGC